jgi:hypothetical protein
MHDELGRFLLRLTFGTEADAKKWGKHPSARRWVTRFTWERIMWGGYLESASCPKQMFKTSTSLFPKMCFPGLLSPPESNESNLSTTCFHGEMSILSSVFIQGYHCFRLRPVPGSARGVGVWPCLWPCGVWSPGDLSVCTLCPCRCWSALQNAGALVGVCVAASSAETGRRSVDVWVKPGPYIFDGSYHPLMVKLGWFTIALLSLLTIWIHINLQDNSASFTLGLPVCAVFDRIHDLFISIPTPFFFLAPGRKTMADARSGKTRPSLMKSLPLVGPWHPMIGVPRLHLVVFRSGQRWWGFPPKAQFQSCVI